MYPVLERTLFFSSSSFHFAVLFWVVYSHVAGNRISVVNRTKANLKLICDIRAVNQSPLSVPYTLVICLAYDLVRLVAR